MDPLINGDYPESMKSLVEERLPQITPDISKSIKGAFDYLGINHYTTLYARNDRTRIRKLILQDASSDAAVITSGKMRHHFSLLLEEHLTVPNLSTLFVVAYRGGVAIGERVCIFSDKKTKDSQQS